MHSPQSLKQEVPNDLQPPSTRLQGFLAAPLWCVRSRESKKALPRAPQTNSR